jgi:hypothetical protein
MSVDFYISFRTDKNDDSDSKEVRDNEFRANHLGNFTDYGRNKHDSDFLYEFEDIIKINDFLVNQEMIDAVYKFWHKLYSYVKEINIIGYEGPMIDEILEPDIVKDQFQSKIGKYVCYRID